MDLNFDVEHMRDHKFTRFFSTGFRDHPKQRRMAHIFLLVMCVPVLWSGCAPDPLEVKNIPKIKSQIVVSSQIIPDRSLLVLLTKTVGALEASDDSDPQQLLDQLAVNDAVVTVTGPLNSYQLMFLGNGVYGGLIIPFKNNEIYTLKVASQTLGEVTASTTVKPMIRFEDIKAELHPNQFDDTLAQITYSIKDPEVANWYMINVQEVERRDVAINVINPRAYTKLLDDSQFNGSEYGEQFRVLFRNYRPGDSVLVSLSNINEDFYKFMKLRIDNRFSLVEFLGEPVNYPSNVEGGKGFFNLYIPDVRFFVLEK
jgi:hypothetical protein